RTLGPDPDELRACLGPRTRAVIVMHLFGQAVDLAPLQTVTRALPILEDAAQAIGTRLHGRHVGTLGKVGTLSFFPAKALGAAGDAGALLTDDAELAQRVRRARVHGSPRAYVWDEPGGNYRIDALQAALLDAKLGVFPARIERRRQIGLRLARAAASRGACVIDGIPACHATFAPFALRVKERDTVLQRLRAAGVDARVQYPWTLPASRAFAPFAGSHPFPVADRASRELLSLPCHAELTDDEVDAIERALLDGLADG
ncbi:MAG TPA: DegT/DnrJ/EryC1/StrS family aminotransferase, partial [Polyangiaceae bacterium]|nr:DegT/DnrJ/EryC1/StrS family aminotransferase [Polyangiaceae bacterium]